MKQKNISTTLAEIIGNLSLHQAFAQVEAIAVQGYDQQRKVHYWNKGSELLYGYTFEEALGNKLEDLIIPVDMSSQVVAGINNWFEHNIPLPASEVTLLHKDGHQLHVYSSHVLFVDEHNQKHLYCIDIDLAANKSAQEQALFKEHMLKAVFEAVPDLFFLMDIEGVIIDYHASHQENLYVPPEEFLGKPMLDILPSTVAQLFKINIGKAITESAAVCFEYELELPHGLTYFEARITYLKNYNQVVTIVRDITEQHKTAEVIRHHAYYDTLTLLPNRFLTLDRLSQMINEAQRNHEKAAILFLDLDDFKKVNDSLGHDIGDKLLIEAAHRLNKLVRKEDTVGRLGGDEFLILMRGLINENNALTISENLLQVFRKPFKIDDRELMLTLSIGIAIYPENGNTASELLKNADTAMYQAKAIGRNTYSFFTKEMNVNMIRRLEIEEQMHGALERNEFEVFYQPQFDTQQRIIGAEALLRWRNAALGNITPDEFIPVAEHTGLIVPIGQFVVKKSLSFLNEWQEQLQRKFKMAINLSPRQFRDLELLNFVKTSLLDANISPCSLELEITEGVLMIGQSYIDEALVGLHGLGIKLSMDDFGTGYSSLSYLRQYDFDILKIDRIFVNGITENKADRDLVTATISMAHDLGLTVVAEGVELKEQVEMLTALKCDYLQGYYFSKPVAAQALISFSAAYKPLS